MLLFKVGNGLFTVLWFETTVINSFLVLEARTPEPISLGQNPKPDCRAALSL